MPRTYNTMATGSQWDPQTIKAVWNKGAIVQGVDATMRRKDICGAWIDWDQHGQTTDYGWEIDHVCPVSHNGSDSLSNLQPLHWQNNRTKSDQWPAGYYCAVTAR